MASMPTKLETDGESMIVECSVRELRIVRVGSTRESWVRYHMALEPEASGGLLVNGGRLERALDWQDQG